MRFALLTEKKPALFSFPCCLPEVPKYLQSNLFKVTDFLGGKRTSICKAACVKAETAGFCGSALVFLPSSVATRNLRTRKLKQFH